MLSREKDIFHECKEIPNSPPKRVCNEILKTKLLQIDLGATHTEPHDLTYIVKFEDVLKIARDEIANLTRTVKPPYKSSSSLLITRQFLKQRAKRSRSTKSCSGKRARTTKLQLTIFIKWHSYIHRVGQR